VISCATISKREWYAETAETVFDDLLTRKDVALCGAVFSLPVSRN
jgi:hypothetical protein